MNYEQRSLCNWKKGKRQCLIQENSVTFRDLFWETSFISCIPTSLCILLVHPSFITVQLMHANDSAYIKEVWSENLEEEMAHLRDLVEEYPYLAMVGCLSIFCPLLIVTMHTPTTPSLIHFQLPYRSTLLSFFYLVGYWIPRCRRSAYWHFSNFLRLPLPDLTLQCRRAKDHSTWYHLCGWTRQSSTQHLYLAIQLQV